MARELPRTFYDRVIPKAQGHGVSVAYSHFVIMLNPRMRGPAFQWEGFVEYAARWARTTAYSSFSDRDWRLYAEEIEAAAENSARHTAKSILEQSGLPEWWPDPTNPNPPARPKGPGSTEA